MRKTALKKRLFLKRRKLRIEKRYSLQLEERRRWHRYQQRLTHSRASLGGTEMLRYYLSRTRRTPHKKSQEEIVVNFPEIFSISEAPDEALAIIETLISRIVNPATRGVYFAQHGCKQIDLGAASLLNLVGIEASKELDLRLRGSVPNNSEMQDLILATGLPRYVVVDLETPPDFENFPLASGRMGPETATSGTQAEAVASDLTAYLNRCFNRFGFQLQSDSERWLLDIIGEVLLNAEEHGGRREWWLSGYLKVRENGSYGECQVTILNLGHTIAESLQSLESGTEQRLRIESMVDRHHSNKSIQPHLLPSENIWTLMGLQHYVSCKNPHIDGNNDRGQGTVRMIEFFQKIGASSKQRNLKPLMTLTSGSTHIVFDNKYKMQGASQGKGIIAFNPSNDLMQPPDPQAVRRLKRFFPGTLLTMNFYIDPENLGVNSDTVERRNQ